MVRPDLTDPAERAAYRRELGDYGRTWRRLGLALLVTGVAVALLRGSGFDPVSLGLVLGGWAVLIPVIIARGRYHRRRMGEDDQANG
jgi:hypothetical protein